MRYITGIHALNVGCSLETGGDWHVSALRWKDLTWVESESMFFKEYGIEVNKSIPEHTGKYYVANHIRACLDLLQLGKFSVIQGMNNDFICNSRYDNEVFMKVYSMRVLGNWNEINEFMKHEYKVKWLNFISSQRKI